MIRWVLVGLAGVAALAWLVRAVHRLGRWHRANRPSPGFYLLTLALPLLVVTVPLVLIFGSAPLLTWLDTTSAGHAAVEALAAFGRFLAASPWNMAAVLLAMGAVFFAITWLLLRRAMIRPAK